MVFLPHCLYALQHSLYTLPRTVFEFLHSLLMTLVRAGGRSRVTRESHHLHMADGGLALPSMEMYYLAAACGTLVVSWGQLGEEVTRR